MRYYHILLTYLFDTLKNDDPASHYQFSAISKQ